MRYAEYLRKSRADDPGEPMEVTLRRHREALDQCMAKLGISVAPEDVFEEVVSGDSLYARPQMLRLMEGVEEGLYDGVLCMDIQRLGRGSMSDQGAILDAFKFSKTKIITPTKIYDLSDETDETYTEFETFLGRQEYKMIKRRLRQGIKATIKNGGYIANAPYGYDKTRVGRTPTLKPNPDEAPIVLTMFRMYDSGVGCQRIADHVNAMGAAPRRKNCFTRNSVRAILHNPVYVGKIVWDRKTHIRPGKQNAKHVTIYNPVGSWTMVPGIHPAIVPQDLFDRVQAGFANKNCSPSYTGVTENPLAGLVVCGNCGYNMQRQASCKGGPLLLCTTRGCIVSSRLDLVEAQVLRMLRDEMNSMVKAGTDSQTETRDEVQETLAAIERQISAAKSQDEKLHDLLEQGVYDTATFLSRHATLSERIAGLERARENCRPQKQIDYAGTAANIQYVLDEYPSLSPEERNRLLKTVTQKIIYRKEKGAKPTGFQLELFLLPLHL